MYLKRLNTLVPGVAALGMMATMSGVGSAAELVTGPVLSYDLAATGGSDTQTMAEQDAETAPVETVAAPVDAQAVECMAKVVMHEAGNQSREGKIAVAQILMNRMKSGRFGATVCDVANQPGQFFNIARFHPLTTGDGWQDAVEIAHEVLAGQADAVVPGAVYFRAAYAPANAFFRSRERVATVGAHIFYR